MLLQVFTVYDSKTETYFQPFYSQTMGAAMRSFEEACNDTEHQFYKYAEDFTLFKLGIYDDQTAEFQLDTPVSLAKAIEMKRNPQNG